MGNIEWLLIDGYSLLHRDERLVAVRKKNFAMARQRLVRSLEPFVHRIAPRTTVVFDGKRGGPGEEFTASSVEVFYSPSHHTADTVIERMVCTHAQPGSIMVVTSDRGERDTVTAAGALSMSCGQFLENYIGDPPESFTLPIKPKKSKGPTLGDFFP